MNVIRQFLVTVCLLSSIGLVNAHAPIIDDSDNFTIVDDRNGGSGRPLAHDSLNDTPEEHALVSVQNSRSSADLSAIAKIQSLEQEVQELRGLLEVQTHELKKLKEQQVAFYKDLDGRISSNATVAVSTPQVEVKPINSTSAINTSELNTKTIPTVQVTPSTKKTKKSAANEEQQYIAAYTLVTEKRYDEATLSLKNFIGQYPDSAYAPNAHYWLGELYLTQKNYPDAITQFNHVLTNYPKANKAQDSRLKLAYALLESGQTDEARTELRNVIKNYPDTQTAQLAALKLQTIH